MNIIPHQKYQHERETIRKIKHTDSYFLLQCYQVEYTAFLAVMLQSYLNLRSEVKSTTNNKQNYNKYSIILEQLSW